MPNKEYYDRLRETADANIQAAANSRDRPTLDQWSSGVNGEARGRSALASREEIDAAEEQGMTIAAYRQLLAEDDAQQEAMRRVDWAGRARQEQQAMRREIGLPDAVLPGANFVRVNGGVSIMFEGRFISGPFSVGPNGRPVVNGVQW